MPDKKTTEETVRSPIDGTELIRLATPGANWQSTLSDIFAALGGGSVASPSRSIQFNNAGAFGGSADLEWIIDATNTTGVTIADQSGIGSSQSYNILSKNASYAGTMASKSGGNLFQGHVAIGNYADVNTVTFSAGDPSEQFTQTSNYPFLVNEFFSGDFSFLGANGGVISTDFKHTGGNISFGITGLLVDTSAATASTGTIQALQGVIGQMDYYGSGNVNFLMAGFSGFAQNFGTANINKLYGLYYTASSGGSGTITDGGGVRVAFGNSGDSRVTNVADWTSCFGLVTNLWQYGSTGSVMTDAGGVHVLAPEGLGSGGTITNLYGLLIEDQSGVGTSNSWNMWSRGAASINRFDGTIQMPEITALAAPAANSANIFVQDNGAGKTQLCVRFPTGAIQVIATEP